ncbi:MAG TPA: universal stress protein [Bryobacteraceae bacterium]
MDWQQILFPVDFSERSTAAAKYVTAMADLFDAKVALLHVVEDPLGWYGSTNPEKVVEVDLPKVLREAEDSLKSFAAAQLPSANVEVVTDFGSPLEGIQKAARTLHADLIMMATHGRGPFRAALLGSVTAKVLHDSPVPVWTEVHEEDPSKSHLPIKKLACAIDLGPESVNVIRFAMDFANRCGAEMFVVHGVPVAEMSLGQYSGIEPPLYMEDFARAEIEKIQREAGSSVKVWTEGNPIPSVVRRAALEWNADLTIIGREGARHLGGGLTGHAYSIIREAPCPVLSL